MRKGMIFVVLVGVFLFALSTMAMAGVVPISQPYSPSLFPIKITQPGSYALMTNIKVPNANTTAILVQTNNVTIDLNGFAISGTTVCVGTPVTSCSPLGTGRGIDATGRDNIKVTNGTIRGMGSDGINVGHDCIIQGVRAISNGGNGIIVSSGTMNGNTANSNGGNGIIVSSDGTVSGNTASYNNLTGIDVGSVGYSGGTVSGNTASYNGGNGISVGHGTVSGNTANSNAFGISVNSGTVSSNTANFNACCGIQVSSSGTVSGNTVSFTSFSIICSGATGFILGSDVGYYNNVLYNGTTDITGGYNMGANLCNGSPCP